VSTSAFGADAAKGPRASVVVWDCDVARRSRVTSVIAACGAQPYALRGATAAPALRRSQVALVAAGERTGAPAAAAEAMRAAASSGLRVLAYADGISAWSTVERCRVLLLGAALLLDSARSDFEAALARELKALLQEQSATAAERERLQEKLAEIGVVAESTLMLQVFRLIVRLAQLSEVPVLIAGESGTGKELLARAVHRLDPKRKDGPFVAVNCAAISPNIVESELFGHARGAFTGAERARKGLIRAAAGGVLFLDEIGEMSLELQAKMLRVLQDGLVTSVGDENAVRADARIVAASNRELSRRVAEGAFRADLYHRLNVVPVKVPPLRERPEDLEPLVRHFVARHRGLAAAPAELEPEFIDALRGLELHGNARELENLVRQALVRKRDSAPLALRDLPAEVWQELCARREGAARAPEREAPGLGPGAPDLIHILSAHGWKLSPSLGDCERHMIHAALARAKGNQTKAAELLGITPRSIYNKLRRPPA
jgi:transcriptional regulator with PAS, ATPase and Fis domain